MIFRCWAHVIAECFGKINEMTSHERCLINHAPFPISMQIKKPKEFRHLRAISTAQRSPIANSKWQQRDGKKITNKSALNGRKTSETKHYAPATWKMAERDSWMKRKIRNARQRRRERAVYRKTRPTRGSWGASERGERSREFFGLRECMCVCVCMWEKENECLGH